MELRQVKNNLEASWQLLEHAVEEIENRVNGHEGIAEEDLVILRDLIMENIQLVERADWLIGMYGRQNYGKKRFAPTARVVERDCPSEAEKNGQF